MGDISNDLERFVDQRAPNYLERSEIDTIQLNNQEMNQNNNPLFDHEEDHEVFLRRRLSSSRRRTVNKLKYHRESPKQHTKQKKRIIKEFELICKAKKLNKPRITIDNIKLDKEVENYLINSRYVKLDAPKVFPKEEESHPYRKSRLMINNISGKFNSDYNNPAFQINFHKNEQDMISEQYDFQLSEMSMETDKEDSGNEDLSLNLIQDCNKRQNFRPKLEMLQLENNESMHQDNSFPEDYDKGELSPIEERKEYPTKSGIKSELFSKNQDGNSYPKSQSNTENVIMTKERSEMGEQSSNLYRENTFNYSFNDTEEKQVINLNTTLVLKKVK